MNQETIFKCCQAYHNYESAIYLCVKPDCKFQPVCCKLCVKEQHQKHLVEELIYINELGQQESLSLKKSYQLIQELENRVKNSLKMMMSLLLKIDVLKQLEEKPSIELLKCISQKMKENIDYQHIQNRLNDQAQQIYQQLEKMVDILKFSKEEDFNYLKLNAQEGYDKAYDLYWNQGNYQEAIKWCDRVLEIDSKHKEALRVKAGSLRMLGQYQESIKYADQAISIDPKYKEAIYIKAESLRGLNQYQESIKYADQAIAIDPKFKEALSTKADSLRMLGQYQESIKYADQAISIDPKYEAALFTKGASLFGLKRYDEALVAINNSLKINPTNEFVLDFKCNSSQYELEHILKAMKK